MRSRPFILGALMIASVVALDPAGWSPFGPAKWLAISTLGFAGGGLMLWRRSSALHRGTFRLWAGLSSLLLIAALTDNDVATALIGQPDRHLGIVTWLLFWLLFCAGQLLDDAGRRIVVAAGVAAAGALGAYCAIEFLFGRPIAIDTTTRRLMGPYGSASFLGAASCLLLPLAAGVAFDASRGRGIRIASAGAGTTVFVALVGSGSRAAWVGIAVAVVVAVVVGQQLGSRRQIVAVSALAIGLAVGVSVHLGDVVQRDHGAASRLDEWQVAARVVADHPLTGVGPEGYRIAAADGIDAFYERTYGRDRVVPDRAHSAPLDVALAAGIPGGLVYVVLVGWVVVCSVRVIRRGPAVRRGLALGVVAYGIQQLFLFPLAEVDPLWWLLAGIVVTVSRGPMDAVLEPSSDRSASVGSAVGIGACVLAAIAFAGGVLDVAADRLVRRSLAAAATDQSNAIEDAQRAVDLRPDVITFRLVVAEAHLRRGTLADIDAAIAQSRAALRWSAHDPLALDEYGVALLHRAVTTGTTDDVDAALAQWRQLVEVDPHRARWQLELGRAAALAGDSAHARAAWTRAASLDPTDTTAQRLLDELDAHA